MRNREIADLHAALSWDLDDFESGRASIDAGFDALAGKARALGNRFKTLGRDMTLGLTVPIGGLATSIAVMAKGSAESLKEIGNAARLANEDVERFQAQAHAAKSVGIEHEKLGQIFADSREKIGEFAATGSGELADFFENIAPRVNLTKDAFVGLSGKDGLQLYYNALVRAGAEQQEIEFYMEAIASDARDLIPLLAENGRQFEELGAKANIFTPDEIDALLRYREALRDISIAMDRIVIAAVNSGLIDMLTSLAEKVADWITGLTETNPAILRFAAGIAIAVAAIGPLVMLLTTVAVIVLPLFLARLGPIFFLLSALINPVGTTVVFLSKLAGSFLSLAGGVGGVLSVLGRLIALLLRMHPVAAAVVTVFTLFGRDIVDALGRVWDKAKEALGPSLQRMFQASARMAGQLREAFDRIANSPLGQFISGIIGLLGDLVGALVEIAGSAVIFAIDLIIAQITAVSDLIADTVRIVELLLQGDWSGAWQAASEAVARAINNMKAPFDRLIGWIHDALAALGILESRQQEVTGRAVGQTAGQSALLSGGSLTDEQIMASLGNPLPEGPRGFLGAVPGVGNSAGGRGSRGRTGPSQEELSARREELELQHELDLARVAGDEARIRSLQRQLDLRSRIERYERAGLSNADARVKAAQELEQLAIVRRDAALEEVLSDQLRNQLQEARIRGDIEGIRFLEQELFLEEEIADLIQLGLDAAAAEEIASSRLLKLEEARADAIAKRVQNQEVSRQIELARLRGDSEEKIRALEEGQRFHQRVDELRRDYDLDPAEAEAQAMREASDRSRAHLQGNIRDAFRGGLRAALDGNLKDFFKRWMENGAFNALSKVLDRLADRFADLLTGSNSKSGGGGLLGGLGSLLGIFGGGGAAPASKLNSLQSKFASLPKFNSGGSFRIAGVGGIDRNLLSLNGSPIARVSSGEIMDIRKGENAGAQGELIVRMQKDGGLVGHLRGIAGTVFNERAPALAAATQQSTLTHFANIQDNRLE